MAAGWAGSSAGDRSGGRPYGGFSGLSKLHGHTQSTWRFGARLCADGGVLHPAGDRVRRIGAGPVGEDAGGAQGATSGAVEQARGAIAAAEAETSVYEDKLRSARSEMLAARERRVQQSNAEREKAIAAAKGAAQERVKAARAEIEAASVAARGQIESASAQLSEQILRAVLPGGAKLSEAQQ